MGEGGEERQEGEWEQEDEKEEEAGQRAYLSVLLGRPGCRSWQPIWNEGAILKLNIWVVAIHLPACMHSSEMHPLPEA